MNSMHHQQDRFEQRHATKRAPVWVDARGDRWLVLSLVIVLLTTPYATAATTSYFIGNSLTWDSQPLGVEAIASDFGFDLTAGYHIRCSWSLNEILANPDNTCEPPVPDTFDTALPNNEWSAVTFQPHANATFNSTLLSDFEAIVGTNDQPGFIDLATSGGANSDTTFYIYSGWPKQANFNADWTSAVVDDDATPTINARGYYEILIERVRAATGAKVNMIPTGEVLYELGQRIEAGQVAGFTEIGDLFRDTTHLTRDVGRYMAGLTVFATMFGVDPAGSTKPNGFYGEDAAFSPALYAAIQDVVWDVVTANPYAGSIFSPGDFNKDETVDGADLAFFESFFGIDGGGDADRDGDTDGADFLAWQRQLAPPLIMATATVPEPSTLSLVLLFFVGWVVAEKRCVKYSGKILHQQEHTIPIERTFFGNTHAPYGLIAFLHKTGRYDISKSVR